MIGRIRTWVPRVLALGITLLTLGRISVRWDGVDPSSEAARERPAVMTTVDDEPSR